MHLHFQLTSNPTMPFSTTIPIPTSHCSCRGRYLNISLHNEKFKPFHFVSFSLRNRFSLRHCFASRIFSDAHSPPRFLPFPPPPSSHSASSGSFSASSVDSVTRSFVDHVLFENWNVAGIFHSTEFIKSLIRFKIWVFTCLLEHYLFVKSILWF